MNISFKTKSQTFFLTCQKTKARQKSMEALCFNIDTLIQILREKEFEIASYVIMGYHNYNIWKSTMKEQLEARMEPDNIMDEFAVTVVKRVIWKHIMKGKTGRFAKKMFYFLRASTCRKCHVQINGKAGNHGDLKIMKVPCIITFVGKSHFISVLTNEP